MKYSKKILVSIFWIVLGITLNVLCYFDVIEEFWSGFSFGIIIVGILQLIRQIRYRTNKDYKEKVDVELNDERNKYIANKAWAWAGYVFVILASVATILFKVFGFDELMMLSSSSVCIIMLTYYIAYIILKRKY